MFRETKLITTHVATRRAAGHKLQNFVISRIQQWGLKLFVIATYSIIEATCIVLRYLFLRTHEFRFVIYRGMHFRVVALISKTSSLLALFGDYPNILSDSRFVWLSIEKKWGDNVFVSRWSDVKTRILFWEVMWKLRGLLFHPLSVLAI